MAGAPRLRARDGASPAHGLRQALRSARCRGYQVPFAPAVPHRGEPAIPRPSRLVPAQGPFANTLGHLAGTSARHARASPAGQCSCKGPGRWTAPAVVSTSSMEVMRAAVKR